MFVEVPNNFVDRVVRYLSGNLRLAGSALVDSYVPLRSAPGPASVLANTDVIDPEGHRPLSLGEARTAQTFRLARAGFYQIRFANGQDAVIGVNADRRESNRGHEYPFKSTLLEQRWAMAWQWLRGRLPAAGRRTRSAAEQGTAQEASGVPAWHRISVSGSRPGTQRETMACAICDQATRISG